MSMAKSSAAPAQPFIDQPCRIKAARQLCEELSYAGLKWFETESQARGYGLNPKMVWDALVSERCRRGAESETSQALYEALSAAVSEIQAFYDAAAEGRIKTVVSVGQFARLEKMRAALADAAQEGGQ